jgi:hypothetical protein
MLSAPEVLNREFLEIRCKILDVAAAFDRLSRATGSVTEDPRMARLREALTAILADEGAILADGVPAASDDRAEQVQMIFSRPYEKGWQQAFQVKPR